MVFRGQTFHSFARPCQVELWENAGLVVVAVSLQLHVNSLLNPWSVDVLSYGL